MSRYIDCIINYYVGKLKFFVYVDLFIRLLSDVFDVMLWLIFDFDIDIVVGV